MGWTDKGIEGELVQAQEQIKLEAARRAYRDWKKSGRWSPDREWKDSCIVQVNGKYCTNPVVPPEFGICQEHAQVIHAECDRIETCEARAEAVDVGAGWHRNYEQRIQDMWGRMVAGWEKAGMVEDGYWQGWANAVEEICVIVADADEEIERMRAEIQLLKGRGVRDGLEDSR